jgi:hypothetical protein
MSKSDQILKAWLLFRETPADTLPHAAGSPGISLSCQQGEGLTCVSQPCIRFKHVVAVRSSSSLPFLTPNTRCLSSLRSSAHINIDLPTPSHNGGWRGGVRQGISCILMLHVRDLKARGWMPLIKWKSKVALIPTVGDDSRLKSKLVITNSHHTARNMTGIPICLHTKC